MSRVTSLTSMPEQQLNRWIKRVAFLFVIGLIAFTAFYVVDRYHPLPKASPVDAQVTAAEEAVRVNPGDIAARGSLADLYVKVKRYADAITQYDAILATGQSEELAKMGRATANQALGNLDAAITDWTRVVEIAAAGEMAATDTNLATAYYELGIIASQQNRPGDAVGFFTKSLDINRTDADTMYALGTAYTANGQPDKAVPYLKSAIQFVPVGWAEPYAALDAAYTKLGNTPMASWAGAMTQLASGDPAGAVLTLTPLVSGPAAIDAMLGLGFVAETRGDTATAATWYQKVLDKDPTNPSARLALSRVRPVQAAASPSASPSQKVAP